MEKLMVYVIGQILVINFVARADGIYTVKTIEFQPTFVMRRFFSLSSCSLHSLSVSVVVFVFSTTVCIFMWRTYFIYVGNFNNRTISIVKRATVTFIYVIIDHKDK